MGESMTRVFEAFSNDVFEDFPYLENCENDYLDRLMSFLYYNTLPRYFEAVGDTEEEVLDEYNLNRDGGDDEKIHEYLSGGIRIFNQRYDEKAKK